MNSETKIVVGIDESGRGPVIGPLVMCAYALPEANHHNLTKDGVKDSKLLTPVKRSQLSVKLKKGTFITGHLTAAEITQAMHKRISLNELEASIAGDLLNKLTDKIEFQLVYVDSPDPQPEKFARRIKKYYKGDAVIISENKADVNYPCVSAASIIAKVERDEEIEKLKQKIGEDFGSGYTSDPTTQDFLKRRHGDALIQEHLRHAWKTLKNLKTKQMALGEF